MDFADAKRNFYADKTLQNEIKFILAAIRHGIVSEQDARLCASLRRDCLKASNKIDLIDFCKAKRIRGYSRLRKKEIIDLLVAHDSFLTLFPYEGHTFLVNIKNDDNILINFGIWAVRRVAKYWTLNRSPVDAALDFAERNHGEFYPKGLTEEMSRQIGEATSIAEACMNFAIKLDNTENNNDWLIAFAASKCARAAATQVLSSENISSYILSAADDVVSHPLWKPDLICDYPHSFHSSYCAKVHLFIEYLMRNCL